MSHFLMRWKGKASKMPNHPSENDQVRVVMMNILPTYGHQLAPIPLKTFVDLYDAGIQIEDAIIVDLLRRVMQNLKRSLG